MSTVMVKAQWKCRRGIHSLRIGDTQIGAVFQMGPTWVAQVDTGHRTWYPPASDTCAEAKAALLNAINGTEDKECQK